MSRKCIKNNVDFSILVKKMKYRIPAYNMPLLIKPPLQQNLNNIHFFDPKVRFLRLFGERIQKISINYHQKNPQIFINRQQSIGADTVVQEILPIPISYTMNRDS